MAAKPLEKTNNSLEKWDKRRELNSLKHGGGEWLCGLDVLSQILSTSFTDWIHHGLIYKLVCLRHVCTMYHLFHNSRLAEIKSSSGQWSLTIHWNSVNWGIVEKQRGLKRFQNFVCNTFSLNNFSKAQFLLEPWDENSYIIPPPQLFTSLTTSRNDSCLWSTT